MARRIIVAKPSFENVQQIQSTLHRVGTKFEAKNDPQKSLADEIEVGATENRNNFLRAILLIHSTFYRHAEN